MGDDLSGAASLLTAVVAQVQVTTSGRTRLVAAAAGEGEQRKDSEVEKAQSQSHCCLPVTTPLRCQTHHQPSHANDTAVRVTHSGPKYAPPAHRSASGTLVPPFSSEATSRPAIAPLGESHTAHAMPLGPTSSIQSVLWRPTAIGAPKRHGKVRREQRRLAYPYSPCPRSPPWSLSTLHLSISLSIHLPLPPRHHILPSAYPCLLPWWSRRGLTRALFCPGVKSASTSRHQPSER